MFKLLANVVTVNGANGFGFQATEKSIIVVFEKQVRYI